ncbi:MAG: hypothetical protein PHT91_02930 [Candidatus Nanoarchaeia archaeon]|nr:hypothetical protein [Candidatus Nanoarchaeia archaeon]MDD5054574.1 hypothetical protein [Candidatus Nanoarchaeia archaeon]MDD5499803.1 hypothetical protein [Candidatus Nanoarchaeia archaeon]
MKKSELDLNTVGILLLGLAALAVLVLLYMGLKTGGMGIVDTIKSLFL